MDFNKLYFYTASILNWEKLLIEPDFKQIIINSLRHLVKIKKIKVYAFVIMPNHIHILWELIDMNGKELPHTSFMKFTAHQFQKKIRNEIQYDLEIFRVDRTSRKYQFWQRDSLPILLYSKEVILQKLNYIHNNPLQSHWRLSELPQDYPYSSAAFYIKGEQSYEFLSHVGEWF